VYGKHLFYFYWLIVVFEFLQGSKEGPPLTNFKIKFLCVLAMQWHPYIQIVCHLLVVIQSTGFEYQYCLAVLMYMS